MNMAPFRLGKIHYDNSFSDFIAQLWSFLARKEAGHGEYKLGSEWPGEGGVVGEGWSLGF